MAIRKKTAYLQVRLTEEDKKAVQDAAWRDRVSVTEFTKRALKYYIDTHAEEEPENIKNDYWADFDWKLNH